MKLTDLWRTSKKPTLSFELFPARTEKAAANLEKAIDALAGLKPDFVSVTFGAGGSTREGSRQLLEKLKRDKGLEVLGYFAGFGLGPEDITAVLDSYQAWAEYINKTRNKFDFSNWKDHDSYQSAFEQLLDDLKISD